MLIASTHSEPVAGGWLEFSNFIIPSPTTENIHEIGVKAVGTSNVVAHFKDVTEKNGDLLDSRDPQKEKKQFFFKIKGHFFHEKNTWFFMVFSQTPAAP